MVANMNTTDTRADKFKLSTDMLMMRQAQIIESQHSGVGMMRPTLQPEIQGDQLGMNQELNLDTM